MNHDFPMEAIYESKKDNLLIGSFKNGEKLVFRGNCSPSQKSKGYAHYARETELWNSKVVNIKNLKAI